MQSIYIYIVTTIVTSKKTRVGNDHVMDCPAASGRMIPEEFPVKPAIEHTVADESLENSPSIMQHHELVFQRHGRLSSSV